MTNASVMIGLLCKYVRATQQCSANYLTEYAASADLLDVCHLGEVYQATRRPMHGTVLAAEGEV